MYIACLNSIMTTYTDGGMVVIGVFNEDILYGRDHDYVHSFLTVNEFTQHIQVLTTDSGTFLDHMYMKTCIIHRLLYQIVITVIMIQCSVL